MNIIEDSESDFCSPLNVVKEKNNSLCLCIDYRRLNSVKIKLDP